MESKLGWSVPDVYGDPGLLLPDVVPKSEPTDRIAVIPHYAHQDIFRTQDSGSVNVISVKSDAETCARQISSASVVISSSLHGLIVAQAYQIPWLWMKVEDHQLIGDDFKFRDFFSCLDEYSVASVEVHRSDLGGLDFRELAKRATLPSLKVDLDSLRVSMPVEPASRPVDAFWSRGGAPQLLRWK